VPAIHEEFSTRLTLIDLKYHYNFSALLACVIENAHSLGPGRHGAEYYSRYEEGRLLLYRKVRQRWCKETGGAPYQFPYSIDAVVDLHTRYRKCTKARKLDWCKAADLEFDLLPNLEEK